MKKIIVLGIILISLSLICAYAYVNEESASDIENTQNGLNDSDDGDLNNISNLTVKKSIDDVNSHNRNFSGIEQSSYSSNSEMNQGSYYSKYGMELLSYGPTGAYPYTYSAVYPAGDMEYAVFITDDGEEVWVPCDVTLDKITVIPINVNTSVLSEHSSEPSQINDNATT
ncbi:hypothetical protein [Methanobrevibacter sp.]|uniref:hypothetical protein n=1 Tax=Methanobrevibacter sp. TaxID=66852 RepID=UPI00388F032C